MKLYTEEQVRQMLEFCILSDKHPDVLTLNDVLKTQTPFELPSDEELSEEPVDLFLGDPKSINNILKYKAFQRGAKWMRDKIQGGNK
jgi:hypothetical protein